MQIAHSFTDGVGAILSQRVAKQRGSKWVIFFYKDMKDMASKVQKQMGIAAAELAELEWDHFPDGFPNLRMESEHLRLLETCDGTCFILSLHSPQVIFEQLALLYALPKHRASNLRVILPWFSTGTMERVETLGQVATAHTMARMISAMPMGAGGPATLAIYDIHALGEQFYFSDQVLVELKSAVYLLRRKIQELQAQDPTEEFAIAFPDDGAHKRFYTKFPEFPTVVCIKQRVGDERIVKVKEGEPHGKHCVIVDDLVQSGGTLLQCAKPLREMGATKVSCFVTHGVFPQGSHEKFVGNDLIDHFWITDSIPTVSALNGKAPFEVLSLAPLIARYLQGMQED